MTESRSTGLLGAWSALGLGGAVLTALAAPAALHDGVVGWWYHPALGGAEALVYVGMGALALAWLGVAVSCQPTRRQALIVAAAWAAPLVLAPPLFSRDVYSYLAQGTLLHLGHDPYRQAPAVLAGLHHGHVLAAVSPFWRHTTAPYGPLFLELVNLIVAICGAHLVAAVLACRALDLLGLGLVVAHLPRLAQALRSDAARATWLVAASPLVLLGLVAPAHNDLLMVGLLVWALSAALRGNPLLGIALCALAATIKVPAIVGAAFVLVCWARTERGEARAAFVAVAAGIVAVVLGTVTLASGVGVRWLSSSVFSTPAKVRLAITPATAVGDTIAWLGRAVGVSIHAHGLESALGVVATALVAAAGLVILGRARVATLVVALGATLVLAAAGGPAAWPWYFSWGLTLLAVAPGVQRGRALLAALLVGGLLVKPNGILAVPLGAAPAVVLVLLVLAGWAAHARRRSRAAGPPPPPAAPAPDSRVLVGT